MVRFHPRMASAKFVFWTAPRNDLPPAWSDAWNRLEEAESSSSGG
jgi:hypothetical protein